jgi:hypothetical protein
VVTFTDGAAAAAAAAPGGRLLLLLLVSQQRHPTVLMLHHLVQRDQLRLLLPHSRAYRPHLCPQLSHQLM